MQKLRLQNVYNRDTKTFDRGSFELRETDGTIAGKVSISTKKDDKWISKPIPFVAFKSKIDEDTTNALLHSGGESFEAEFNLAVDSFTGEDGKTISYFKMIINSAKCDGVVAPVVNHSEDSDDEIPF